MYNVKISQVMTPGVISVTPNTIMNKVQELFESNNFHHLPVIDEKGKLCGIISESDYLLLLDNMTKFRKADKAIQNNRFLSSLLVSDVMTTTVVKLKETDLVSVAAGYFRENLFHAIPIVNEAEELVGILTTFDMINYAYKQPCVSCFKNEVV